MPWFIPVPDGVSPALYVAFLALGVLVTGIAKAGFGGGVGILAVPLIAAVLPAQRALGMMLPLLILADMFANLHHLRNQSRRHLTWLLTGAVLGIALGTGILLALRETSALNTTLNLLVGGVCLILVSLQVYRMVGGKVPHLPQTPAAGCSTGSLAGFVSTLAHSAGPVVSIYLLEQKLDKRLLVGTSATFFLFTNIAKLPTYASLGFITRQSLLDSLWVTPLVPVGTLLGYWMHKRVAEKPFVVIMYAGAAAAAAHMVYKSLL